MRKGRKEGETGKCQNWKVSELESVRIGKCQNWKVPELESVGIGKCLNWKMSELESVGIGKCQNPIFVLFWKKLESVGIPICGLLGRN